MTTSATGASTPRRERRGMANLQRFGRSLMLPIAALPAAGLLLRLGAPDLIGAVPGLETVGSVISAAGGALFDNLPLLFAVGIAIGWARKADGSTALAAVVGYLVLAGVFKVMSPIVLAGQKATDGTQAVINFGVLGGIVVGLVAATLWQRFYRTKLPDYIGFFGGRRLVPILTAVATLVIGVVLSLVYPLFNTGLTAVGNAVQDNAVIGGGIYGVLNRLLIPLGLHHIINSVVWFLIGDYNGVHGDLNRFFAGDPNAGLFMTGFFPIMMFALPAAALAIWHEARPSQRKIIGGVMLSTGLTSFITGITEPLEFSFMFVAWPLYVIHAVLTGTSIALVNALGIHHGFSFSAGAIDFLLNFGKSTGGIWLIPIGLGYAVIYYVVFRFVIRRWNLRTPGREDTLDDGALATAGVPADEGTAGSRTAADEASAAPTTTRAGEAAPRARGDHPAG
ncbi:PTS transporter subunit EIIC [Tersicoccus phoenicis]|uniref:PTS transporter subunit EIIC n=1 Tax=Tersicoccus phoenicis TaxID=554083 RepID=UPI000A034C7F|nr:PTS transporter subunit EIIC [Tersicoccus phoenicis]